MTLEEAEPSEVASENVEKMSLENVQILEGAQARANTPGDEDAEAAALATRLESFGSPYRSRLLDIAGSSGTDSPLLRYCDSSPSPSPEPDSSPRTARRPLRESRRISIDNTDGQVYLNQYRLLDSIGKVSSAGKTKRLENLCSLSLSLSFSRSKESFLFACAISNRYIQ